MQALVTGSSGFLGGRLVDMLLAQGARVTVLARAGSSLPNRPGVRVVRASLVPGEDKPDALAAVQGALAGSDVMFHCAGCSTDWAPLRQFQQANVDYTRLLLDLALRHARRLDRFLHVSTTDVYGYPLGAGDEHTPLRSAGLPYNETKRAGEEAVWAAAAKGLPVTVLRPASIYGPGGKAFVTDIAALLRQRAMLLVDGGRVRGGFVYVDDVCRAMLRAAGEPRARGEAFNLSSVDGVTWRAYAAALARALGVGEPWLKLPFAAAMALARASELPYRAGLKGRPLLTRHAVYLLSRDQQYATAKAREQLNWSPRVGLEEGIERSAALLVNGSRRG